MTRRYLSGRGALPSGEPPPAVLLPGRGRRPRLQKGPDRLSRAEGVRLVLAVVEFEVKGDAQRGVDGGGGLLRITGVDAACVGEFPDALSG
jgi:hypothetical protein